ncbi:CoA transferase [Halomonas sp. MCCC 1A17488]|uniref:CoA transferase n=1 Tax=Billgrantia sulfidoxydans TaxID=2733484 RepID=A0ABX7W8D2_9GAMM|nr:MULTISPECIES: CaiB/BaiF CoA-transferase family protein [Halomonas]MCE8018427.1 CoA transferase [Halomonas sp. MCCC 1A17488]MCG3241760.1 CoA transferase [Halomonas sp. MCCC 1A17488]QPP49213.1 CoA transferase [Halomonas sp. SS10-MC5]QTP56568.1 CoA transferase [Halomonas sulfidoxydans]
MAGPLTGLRVLDLSRVMAGPWCTQMLADMGAEVIKIERPTSGDDTRHWGPPWLADHEGNATRESAYYLSANRGKHSVTVDMGKPEGQALIRELAAESDILVENFKSGGLARKGLDYVTLEAINPGLIYCSITGFGQTGPMAAMAGYDYLIQAQGGLMSITGAADGEPGAGPQRVGMAVADLTTGMNATIAILGALHHRHLTGEGQYIDMALLDVQVSWLANQAQNYFCSGTPPTRTGEYHPNLVPYQPFPTADGEKVIIAIGNDGQFQRFCRAVGRPELAEDPRFATNPERVRHRLELVPIMVEITRTRSSTEWMALLREIAVPCGPIQNIAQVFDDPQVKAREMKIELESRHGPVPGVANPIKYSRTPIEYCKAPPALGEDTDAVLARLLGKAPEEIEALRRRGAI